MRTFERFSIFVLLIALLLEPCYSKTIKKIDKEKESEAQLLKKIRRLAKEAGHPDPKSIRRDETNSEVCFTRTCLESAVQILEAIDFSEDPCDKGGFAKYSCHRRLHREPDSFHKSQYGNISLVTWIIQVQNQEFTREILEAPILPFSDESSRALINAKIFYSQCLNWGENSKSATRSLFALSQKFGGWSILTQEEPKDIKWETFAAFLAQFKAKTLLFDISPVTTEQGIELSLDKGSIASISFTSQEFKKSITKVLHMIRERWDDTGADFDLPESFEAGIAGTTEALEQLQQYSAYFNTRIKKRMTIAQLNEFTHHRINWLEFFQTAFKATSIDIEEDTYVHVNKKYVETLTKLWNSAGMWDISLLQYELFSTFMRRTSLIGDALDILTSNKELMKLVCVELSKQNFGAAMSKDFLKRHPYTTDIKKDISQMTDNVINGLTEFINSSSFLYSNAKSKLVKKYERVSKFLGYPEWLDHAENFTRYYSKLENFVNNDTQFLANHLKLTAWNEGVNRDGFAPSEDNLHYWDLNKFIVDVGGASYMALSNAMLIPAPTSAPPLYRFGAPGYINYGGLGTILGHELGHGMDSNGIYFDRNGNYKKKGLLGSDGQEKYDEWIRSIKRDYKKSKIHYHGQLMNGTIKENLSSNMTIKDDVADIVGVQVAFNAYKTYLSQLPNQTDMKLPGLNHIPDEHLFFVTYSNMWCSEMTEMEAKISWAASHSPGYNRATLPLKRSKQFAETFQCEHKNIFEV